MIETILSRIDDVSEELTTRAAEMETARRMPLDLAQTLASTGAFSLLTQKAWVVRSLALKTSFWFWRE